MDINNILDQFADDVVEIDIWNKKIEGILDFSRFSKLIKLNCCNNQITSLDNLPNSLIELHCGWNQIISLDNLTNSLIKLNCTFNKITSLDNLPNSLTKLYCDNTVKDYDELMKKYNKLLIKN